MIVWRRISAVYLFPRLSTMSRHGIFLCHRNIVRVMWDSMSVLQGVEQEGAHTSNSSPPSGTFHPSGKQNRRFFYLCFCYFEFWLKLEFLVCHEYTLYNDFPFRFLKGTTVAFSQKKLQPYVFPK